MGKQGWQKHGDNSRRGQHSWSSWRAHDWHGKNAQPAELKYNQMTVKKEEQTTKKKEGQDTQSAGPSMTQVIQKTVNHALKAAARSKKATEDQHCHDQWDAYRQLMRSAYNAQWEQYVADVDKYEIEVGKAQEAPTLRRRT